MEGDQDEWAAGVLIRAARGSRRVRRLAASAGISEGYWRQIEKGYEQKRGIRIPVNPSDAVLEAVAHAATIDPEELFRAAGRPGPPPIPATGLRPRTEAEFRATQAGPSVLQSGHGGSEGWPPWLEQKFRDLEDRVDALAAAVAALRAVVDPAASRGRQ